MIVDYDDTVYIRFFYSLWTRIFIIKHQNLYPLFFYYVLCESHTYNKNFLILIKLESLLKFSHSLKDFILKLIFLFVFHFVEFFLSRFSIFLSINRKKITKLLCYRIYFLTFKALYNFNCKLKIRTKYIHIHIYIIHTCPLLLFHVKF